MFSQKAKRIINSLHDDATVPMDEIGSKVGITRQNVSTYLEKFTTGKILAYTIVENPNVLESRTFFIEIKTNPEEPDVVEFLEDIPGVRSIDGIIGENSLVVKFAARNNVQFASILDRVDQIITGTRFQHYKIVECLKTFKDGGKTLVKPGEGTAVHQQAATVSIDPLDEDILHQLSTMDDRFSYEGITEKLRYKHAEVSYARVRNRVRYMQDAGLVHSFTIKLMPAFIPETDYALKFYLRIIPKQLLEYTTIATDILVNEDKIVELYRTGQEYGLFAVVRTGSIAEYKAFLENLYQTGKIQDTFSTLVIDEKLPAVFKPFKDDAGTS